MRQLASQLTTEAATVTDLLSRLNGAVQNTTWVSDAATQFREDWQSKYTPVLRALHEALASNAKDVTARAELIETAGRRHT
jgi:uncharacterized protein YukE